MTRLSRSTTDRLIVGFVVLLAAGCTTGAQSSGPSATAVRSPGPASTALVGQSPPALASSTPAMTPGPGVADHNPSAFVPGVPYAIAIDPIEFTTMVTNPYFPLEPGTTWTFDGAGEHVVVAVTDQTRVIAGVTTIVVHDQGFEGSDLVEDTEDYYVQDAAGNVWYFGEVTAECSGRKVTSRAGSWQAGVAGAQPGVVMLADPMVGDVYRQEYLAGEAEDQATVLQLDAAVTGPTGSYADVLVTEDVTPLEPDLLEHKAYARGIGVIQEETLSGEPGVVELVKVTTGNSTSPMDGVFKPCRG